MRGRPPSMRDELDVFTMGAAASNVEMASCLKKKLGCLLVTASGECIPGYNGPPRPLELCGECRREKPDWDGHAKCRAVHAERRCLLQAARAGIDTERAVLYSYMGVPCKDCMLELIEAGVAEIVCLRKTFYDELSEEILNEWVEKGGKFRVVSSWVKEALSKTQERENRVAPKPEGK